jgi:hypothetical protein
MSDRHNKIAFPPYSNKRFANAREQTFA